MTRILILGGGGMLGHKAFQILSREYEVYATFRHFSPRYRDTRIFESGRAIDSVDASTFDTVHEAIKLNHPEVVLNCVGVIKQIEEAHDPKQTIRINALFPHLLAEVCSERKIKLLQVSTDCVFSGKRGGYRENDEPDPPDLYGRTKLLGEITHGDALTFRTSIIGHELFTHRSLVDWFLSNKDHAIRAYRNAIYTGFPTCVLCREISRLVRHHRELSGLYHIASNAISKYDLLLLIKKVYGVNVEILEDVEFRSDRSLDGERYAGATGFHPPGWEEMVAEMYADFKNYGSWRTL